MNCKNTITEITKNITIHGDIITHLNLMGFNLDDLLERYIWSKTKRAESIMIARNISNFKFNKNSVALLRDYHSRVVLMQL